MSGSIWRIDPTTGTADELTADNKYHSLPAWSPDGRYLTYVADDGGTNIHLYMLEVSTGKRGPSRTISSSTRIQRFRPMGPGSRT